MRILFLGGTIFLGRYTAGAALARGHEVTLFHRGEHGSDLFPGAEHLRGDRNGDLTALRGRTWDAVVDTSAYFPDWVEAAAGLLRDAAGQYVFISSISVYSSFARPRQTEDAPVSELSEEQVQSAYALRAKGPVRAAQLGDLYGGLKVRCERAAEAAFPGRTLVIRPGLIVGPDDYSDRFTYWADRVDRGGEMLAPGRPERIIEFIDVRDLGEWTVGLIERRHMGVLQATGPRDPISMGGFLDACGRAAGKRPNVAWVDESFLLAHEVAPWSELPLWLPEAPENAGFLDVDCSRARAAGLAFRDVDATLRDTLAWSRERPPGERKAGMKPEREAALLEAWKRRVAPASKP